MASRPHSNTLLSLGSIIYHCDQHIVGNILHLRSINSFCNNLLGWVHLASYKHQEENPGDLKANPFQLKSSSID
jgi:hypothetical protein